MVLTGRQAFGTALLVAILLWCAEVMAATTERVSVDSSGDQANFLSNETAISADGRFVTFESAASNLVIGDTSITPDIFVHDRQTGQTVRVSVDSSGNEANSSSFQPTISADGRFVAFRSLASNLVIGDTNNSFDIFVHDRQTGQTERVSVDSLGNQANDFTFRPTISADGRFVAFGSLASNLVIGDTNNSFDIFVHDRQTGQTERVSVDSSGNEANSSSVQSAISADGRFVAFGSLASNLVIGDTNGSPDIFVHDRQTSQTERVSVDSSGNQINGGVGGGFSAISADGRFVTFGSFASNLVIGDTNGTLDIFVHDRQTGQTERVSVDSSGNEANSSSVNFAISADGRFVAFGSLASNLVIGDTNGTRDIFVHDRQTGQTVRVSVDSSGNQANDGSALPAISADGHFVAFLSFASNLVIGDTNNVGDIFVRADLVGEPTTQPEPGQLVGDIQNDRPTIVITHGWQPLSIPILADSPPSWVIDMRDEIELRLESEGKSANILTYYWPEAFGIDLLIASRFVQGQGWNLAKELEARLGLGYDQDIQLIGHSLGTLVNAQAVNVLPSLATGLDITQFTLLDAPLDQTGYSEEDIRSLLPPHPSVTWVDNYFGDPLLGGDPLLVAFGDPIAGAAPDGGQFVERNHSGVHEWYLETIVDPTRFEGFFFSPMLGFNEGFADRPNPRFWNPPSPATISLIRETILGLPEAVIDFGGGAGDLILDAWGLIEGAALEIFQDVGGAFRNTLRLLESSDSTIALSVPVPGEATHFSFDFLFSDLGDRDWLTLSFNGTFLWSFLGESFVGTDFQEATIPIGDFADQSGILQFTLHSVGDVNAQVELSNFRFIQTGMTVNVDIMPRRRRDVIHLDDDEVCKDDDVGKLRVALISSTDFDALTADELTLGLGDPKLIGKATTVRSRIKDVDRDGRDDLLLRFSICELLASGALNRNSTELILSGATFDGVPIAGGDKIRVLLEDDDDDDSDDDDDDD